MIVAVGEPGFGAAVAAGDGRGVGAGGIFASTGSDSAGKDDFTKLAATQQWPYWPVLLAWRHAFATLLCVVEWQQLFECMVGESWTSFGTYICHKPLPCRLNDLIPLSRPPLFTIVLLVQNESRNVKTLKWVTFQRSEPYPVIIGIDG